MNIRVTVVKTGRVETSVSFNTVDQAKARAMSDAVNYQSDIVIEAQGYPKGNWDWGTLGMVQWRGGHRRVVGFDEE